MVLDVLFGGFDFSAFMHLLTLPKKYFFGQFFLFFDFVARRIICPSIELGNWNLGCTFSMGSRGAFWGKGLTSQPHFTPFRPPKCNFLVSFLYFLSLFLAELLLSALSPEPRSWNLISGVPFKDFYFSIPYIPPVSLPAIEYRVYDDFIHLQMYSNSV